MRNLLIMISGYLLGSILFGKIFLKLFKHKDISMEGEDGNPGTFNAFAAGGMLCGVLTLVCDLAKGAIPVALYLYCNKGDRIGWMLVPVMIAPVLGHAFPIYQGFRGGGKAIAVSFGSLLGFFPNLLPALIPAAFYLLYSAMRIQPHAKRSVLTFSCSAAVASIAIREHAVKVGMILICAIVIGRHLPLKTEKSTGA